MIYEWDETKNRANRQKHGIDFADAARVFESATVTFEDDRADYGEQRFISLGRLVGRLVVIVHTPRGETTQIISMRKANAREQEIYQKRLGTP